MVYQFGLTDIQVNIYIFSYIQWTDLHLKPMTPIMFYFIYYCLNIFNIIY